MTGEALHQSHFASGFDAGRARAEGEVQQLRGALGEIWGILVNQQCMAGTAAWKVADDALDEATKQKLIAEMTADD